MIVFFTAALLLTACGDAAGPDTTVSEAQVRLTDFERTLDTNATCGRLVTKRDAIPANTEERNTADVLLQEVGCDSSTSQRNDITITPAQRKSVSDQLCPGAQRLVAYYVDGSAQSIDITINNRQGNTEQATNLAMPLSAGGKPGLRIGCVDTGFFYYIAAQNNGESGTVRCSVTVDGQIVSTANSSGAYVIASCSGSVE